jgi:RecA-family ATPase
VKPLDTFEEACRQADIERGRVPGSKPNGASAPRIIVDNEKPKLPFINMSTWDMDPIPERQWAVQDRIPLKQTYLFTGNGAVGKSLVDLQRAVAHVLGKPWLGMPVRQGPAIYMGAEDDEDELHIRLAAILEYYGATFAEVIAGGLHLLSYVGEECLLGIPDNKGIIQPTPLCGMLREAALDIKPAAVMVDTVADVYGGSEIDRGQTTQFVKLMNGIAVAGNCSVAILAHPSVAGMSTGSGLSGSTAWHNKVRARAYMKAMETERGDEPDPDAKSIQFMKNNYGRQGDTLLVRWQRGVYVLESAPNSLERLAEDQKVDFRFLQLLNQFHEQGRNLSDKKTAHVYAPKEFSEQKDRDGKRISKRHFEGAMQRLFGGNKIHIEHYGPASRGRTRLAPGPRPQREEGKR